jgi:hypothetical protein
MARAATGDARWGAGCLGPADHTLFRLRGASYLGSRQAKQPSPPPLFAFLGGDVVSSAQGPVFDFARRVRFPPLPAPEHFGTAGAGTAGSGGGGGDPSAAAHSADDLSQGDSSSSSGGGGGTAAPTVPAYFVVNMQIPREAKPLFGAKQKVAAFGAPPTCNAVYYFRLAPAAAPHMAALDVEMRGGPPASKVPPACRLLHTWCVEGGGGRGV